MGFRHIQEKLEYTKLRKQNGLENYLLFMEHPVGNKAWHILYCFFYLHTKNKMKVQLQHKFSAYWKNMDVSTESMRKSASILSHNILWKVAFILHKFSVKEKTNLWKIIRKGKNKISVKIMIWLNWEKIKNQKRNLRNKKRRQRWIILFFYFSGFLRRPQKCGQK